MKNPKQSPICGPQKQSLKQWVPTLETGSLKRAKTDFTCMHALAGTATPVEGEVASRVCSVTAIASPYAGLAQPGGSAESECRAGGAGSLCVQQRGGSSDGPQLAVADSSSGMRGKQGVGKSRFAR